MNDAIERFRGNTGFVQHMRELLEADLVFQQAVVALKDGHIVERQSGDALHSVRILSRLEGYQDAVNNLIALCTPEPKIEDESPPDYGTHIDRTKQETLL